MGRNFEFSREETLNRAMQVFWQKGYKATIMRDLIKEMGIQPGSIYNTFGDKHSLFLEALKHYGEVVTANALKILERDASPMENLQIFFNEIILRPADKKCRGCLLVNTVVELAPHDSETADIAKEIMQKIETAFYNCLKKSRDYGEIPKEKNIRALSKFFASSTHGLLVTGKSNTSQEEMRDVVNVIFESLK
jgi:TetR/AcrR family transcriptional repressor of nem operon